MNSSMKTTPASTTGFNVGTFFEKLWRTSGIQCIGLIVVAYLIYGSQPRVGAPIDALIAFYHGGRTHILIASIFSGLAALYLMWFAAALRVTLAEAGQDGWGSAATASSAAVGTMFFLLVAVVTALAYSIAGSQYATFTSGLHDFVWVGFVLTSFPRAMLIMSAAFGLWRAGLISNSLFAAGVTAVVLVLLGGATWASGGFWAPDGAYSRMISPLIGIVWLLVVSVVLLTRSPASRSGW
jgi:hypothetical protein